MNYDALWSILLVFSIGQCVHGIRYTHLPNTQKCFRDEVQAHQLTVIEFEVSDAPGQRIDYVVSTQYKIHTNPVFSILVNAQRNCVSKFFCQIIDLVFSQIIKFCLASFQWYDPLQIRDSKNGILAKKEGMSHQAKASFTTEFADTYELCIVSHVVSQGKLLHFYHRIVTAIFDKL